MKDSRWYGCGGAALASRRFGIRLLAVIQLLG
jgi:hypothetical protein